MRRFMIRLLLLAALGFLAFWMLTAPKTLPASAFSDVSGDATSGARVFYAAGCASCHAAPEAKGDDKLILAGGQRFASPFGTFIAPNISPSAEGIGDWSLPDLANAMIYGTSPKGQHYYPAFPYASYVRMKLRGTGLQAAKRIAVSIRNQIKTGACSQLIKMERQPRVAGNDHKAGIEYG